MLTGLHRLLAEREQAEARESGGDWVIVGLCLAFAVVTPPAAIAQGHMFSEGFSQDQYARLMLWEDFRTAIFTLIGVLALVVMRRRLMSTESRSAVDLTKR